jgi:hypothetical protein
MSASPVRGTTALTPDTRLPPDVTPGPARTPDVARGPARTPDVARGPAVRARAVANLVASLDLGRRLATVPGSGPGAADRTLGYQLAPRGVVS